MLLLLLFPLLRPATGLATEVFKETSRTFCLSDTGALKASSRTRCASVCSTRPLCCGFSYNPKNQLCALMEGVPLNKQPKNAISGNCRIFISNRCRSCHSRFNVVHASGPARLFYNPKAFGGQNYAKNFCAGKGGHPTELYPASTIKVFFSESKKIFTSSTIKNSKYQCERYSDGMAYCPMTLVPKMLAGGAILWPNRGATVTSEYYKEEGVTSKGTQPSMMVMISIRQPTMSYLAYIVPRSANKVGAIICECLFVKKDWL